MAYGEANGYMTLKG